MLPVLLLSAAALCQPPRASATNPEVEYACTVLRHLGGIVGRPQSGGVRVEFPEDAAVRNDDLEYLERIPDLCEVHIACKGIGDAGLWRLLYCRGLHSITMLRAKAITDRYLGELYRLPSLERLQLVGAEVSQRTLDRIQSSCPKLQMHVSASAPPTHEVPRKPGGVGRKLQVGSDSPIVAVRYATGSSSERAECIGLRQQVGRTLAIWTRGSDESLLELIARLSERYRRKSRFHGEIVRLAGTGEKESTRRTDVARLFVGESAFQVSVTVFDYDGLAPAIGWPSGAVHVVALSEGGRVKSVFPLPASSLRNSAADRLFGAICTWADPHFDGDLAALPVPERKQLLGETSRQAAFSGDGETIYAIRANEIASFQSSNGSLLAAWPADELGLPLRSRLIRFACSPDGACIAAVGARQSDEKSVAAVWNIAARRAVCTFESDVDGLSFSPDGKRLVCTSRSKVEIRNASSGVVETRYDGLFAAAQYLDDGRLFSIVSRRSGLQLLELPDRRRLGSTGGMIGPFQAAIRLDGTQMALAGAFSRDVRLVDLRDFTSRRLTGHDEPVSTVAYAADGTTAAGSLSGVILFRDAGTGRPTCRPLWYQHFVGFAPDGRRFLARDDDGELAVWTLPGRAGDSSAPTPPAAPTTNPGARGGVP